jgi:hypothetical protein
LTVTKTTLDGRSFLFVAALLFVPAPVWAQVGADVDGPSGGVPVASVSGGLGPMQFQGRRVTMGVAAVQIGVRRHFVIEPEFARWVEADAPGFHSDSGGGVFGIRRRAVTIAGANLLFRAGTSRVIGFAGGGGGVHVAADRFDNPVDPRTSLPIGGPGVARSATLLGLQGTGGVDVAILARVRAFVAIRGEVRPEPNVGVTGGMRWVLRHASGPSPATGTPLGLSSTQGRTVEVLNLDGRRVSGRLLSLSASEMVIATGGNDLQIRLSEVRQVRRPSHWARNLALAGAAVFGGLAVGACAIGGCGGEGLSYLAIEGAIATGAGLAIGAMINAATAERRTVYP